MKTDVQKYIGVCCSQGRAAAARAKVSAGGGTLHEKNDHVWECVLCICFFRGRGCVGIQCIFGEILIITMMVIITMQQPI